VREGIKCQWQPDEDDLEACREFGAELAEATKD
jgi:flavorubredoxin